MKYKTSAHGADTLTLNFRELLKLMFGGQIRVSGLYIRGHFKPKPYAIYAPTDISKCKVDIDVSYETYTGRAVSHVPNRARVAKIGLEAYLKECGEPMP